MITINKIPHAYKLHDYDTFIQTINVMDKHCCMKTYVYKNTLKHINDTFIKLHFHGSISTYIDNLFKNSNTVYSNEDWLTDRDLEKINSIDVILHSLPIRNPLSLNYFGDGKWGAHPGNSRLHFYDRYTIPVNAMICDHSNRIKLDYPDEDFLDPTDTSFSVDNLYILLNNTTKNGPNSIRRPAGRNLDYVELTDLPEMRMSDPRKYSPPRCYRLKINNTLVTVDDRPVIQKVNGEWQIYNH